MAYEPEKRGLSRFTKWFVIVVFVVMAINFVIAFVLMN